MDIDAVMRAEPDWSATQDAWATAADVGIRRGWLWDHLHVTAGQPGDDAFGVLAAVAAVTSRIGVGTMVTSPNFRHPIVAAKAAATLDRISRGRFVLGVGAGGAGADSDACGTPPLTRGDRASRFAEWVSVAQAALAGGEVSHRGRWYSAVDVAVAPPGRAAPPLAIAATRPRGMRVAARHASIWITQDVVKDPQFAGEDPFVEVRRQTELLAEACAREGRDDSTLERLIVLGYGGERPLRSRAAWEDAIGRYAELGFSTAAILWPHGPEAARARELLADVVAEVAPRRSSARGERGGSGPEWLP